MSERTLITDGSDISITNLNETDEILGNPPGWILNWGISLIFIGAVIFGATAWLIKYPDIIAAEITITTSNPPIAVISKARGKIKSLKVINNQDVARDQIIATIDNKAKLDDIQFLEKMLDKMLDIKVAATFLRIKLNKKLDLGDIQNSYIEISEKIEEYQYFLRSNGVLKKIHSLENQIANTHQLNSNLQNQRKRLEKEVLLSRTNLSRHQELNKQGLVADLTLESIETKYLQYKRQLDGIENQIVSNEIQIDQLNIQISDLNESRKDGNQKRIMEINKAIKTLKSDIQQWKQRYLITSPISGKVSFSKIWSEQQFVNLNDQIFTIVPEKGIGKVIGKAILPVENSGKVSINQIVNVRLHGFPYQEFGVISSKVKNISLVPITINPKDKASYVIEVDLPDNLITTYGKTIPFRQEMQGIANIITEDRRVLERVFDRISSILKN